jgi:hypothetical protein
MEAEPDFLKYNVVPRRRELDESSIPLLVDEIIASGLWTPFKDEDGKLIVKEKGFDDHQHHEYKKESKSKWEGKKLVSSIGRRVVEEYSSRDKIKVVKEEISKRAVKEEESVRETKTENDNGEGAFFEKLKDEDRHKETFKQIEKLRLIISANGTWKRAAVWAQMKIQLQYHPEAVLLAIQRVNEFKPNAPEAYADQVLLVESQNHNEADAIKKHEEIKKSTPTLQEALKGAIKNAMSREVP